MLRRSALKSLGLALVGGSLPAVAAQPSNDQVRSSFISARDQTKLHFRDWGAGRTIVLVAPWGLCSDWWDIPVINFCQRGWRCVTFDRRGHARSEDPCRGYDFDTLSDDLAAVLEALDLQNVVLVGHSMGGAEVVRYLTRHQSQRVAHAVLIAPTTPFTLKTSDNPDGAPREALQRFRDALKDDLPRRAAEAAPAFFGAPQNTVSTQTMDWWCRQFVDRCSIQVLTEMHKTMTETDFRAELPAIRTPTLILHGDADQSALLEKTGRPTHELIPGSRLLVYENAAHALPYTHTDRMVADIVAFAGA
jgi:non-heme chloroperoxidase